jgi:hypothetical protein
MATRRASSSVNTLACGPKAKVAGNLDAIRALKAIEEENRAATPEEKVKLGLRGFGRTNVACLTLRLHGTDSTKNPERPLMDH